MKGCLKSCLITGGVLTSTLVIGGIYIIRELAKSPILDQRLSERYGLLQCFQKISWGELSKISECGEYAQHHLPLYSELIGKTPAESVCLISKDILRVLKIDYPSSLGEIKHAKRRVERFCPEEQFVL